MAETLRTEEEYLATMPVGAYRGTSVQDLRDALYSLLRAYYRDWSQGAEPPDHVEGRLYYRDGNLNLMTQIEGVVRQLGEELQLPIARNDTGATITNGTVVYISNAQGQRPEISPASNNDITARKTIAVATQDIADNADGYCTVVGIIRDIDTSAWTEGTELFLGVDGQMTSTMPTGMADVVSVGFVTTQNATTGEILVVIKHVIPTGCQFGMWEARPLQPSTSFSDLVVWGWADEKFQPITGNIGTTDWTIDEYRDTEQRKFFLRHDQNNELHADIQMSHEWAGTPVRLHIHTIPMAAGSGDVYWTGRYYFGHPTDELPSLASWTTFTATQSLTVGDQYSRDIQSLATCTGPSDPTTSSILSIRVLREGTNILDTYSTNKDHGTPQANLCIESYDVHYQRLLHGSSELFSGAVVENPAASIFDPRYHHGDVYLRLAIKSTNGNECEFQLYDVTAGAAISGTAVTTSTNYEVIELGPLTLAQASHHYIVQGRYTGAADEPRLSSAKFVVR